VSLTYAFLNSGFLLLVLDPDKMDVTRYEHARKTVATVIVPHLDAIVDVVTAMGAEQVDERFTASRTVPVAGCGIPMGSSLNILSIGTAPSMSPHLGLSRESREPNHRHRHGFYVAYEFFSPSPANPPPTANVEVRK